MRAPSWSPSPTSTFHILPTPSPDPLLLAGVLWACDRRLSGLPVRALVSSLAMGIGFLPGVGAAPSSGRAACLLLGGGWARTRQAEPSRDWGGPWPPCCPPPPAWGGGAGAQRLCGPGCCLGADRWGRVALPRVAVSGPMAFSGLKLRGKDIGKPIEKGPRAK